MLDNPTFIQRTVFKTETNGLWFIFIHSFKFCFKVQNLYERIFHINSELYNSRRYIDKIGGYDAKIVNNNNYLKNKNPFFLYIWIKNSSVVFVSLLTSASRWWDTDLFSPESKCFFFHFSFYNELLKRQIKTSGPLTLFFVVVVNIPWLWEWVLS